VKQEIEKKALSDFTFVYHLMDASFKLKVKNQNYLCLVGVVGELRTSNIFS